MTLDDVRWRMLFEKYEFCSTKINPKHTATAKKKDIWKYHYLGNDIECQGKQNHMINFTTADLYIFTISNDFFLLKNFTSYMFDTVQI